MVGHERKTGAMCLCQVGACEEQQSRGAGVWEEDSKNSCWEVCRGMCEYDFNGSIWARIVKFYHHNK